MRWIYEIERAGKAYQVAAKIDGRPGLGTARHRRRQKAMTLAERSYLLNYPVTLKEVINDGLDNL